MSQITDETKTEEPNGYLGMLKLSPDIWYILSAIAQLERNLIAERVRNGLANARAKGRRIGRVKTRNSALIRNLLDAGLSYREISRIAKCSHGSVWAEKQAKIKDEALRKQGIQSGPETQVPEAPAVETPGSPTAGIQPASVLMK